MAEKIRQFLISHFLGSRLQLKFVLVFIILAAVPVFILGITAIYLIDLSHRRDVSGLEMSLIDQEVGQIKKFLADTLGIIELRVGFTQKSEIELSQQQFLLGGLLEENRAFEEVSFISLEGLETAKIIRGGGEVELQNVSQLPKFKTAKDGKNFIGEIGHTLVGPILTLAAPVVNRNGDIIQILSAEVNLRQIVTFTETQKLGLSGYLILTDNHGVMIAPRRIGRGRSGNDLSAWSRVKQILEGKILNALNVRDRYESFFNFQPVIGAGRRVPEIDWAVLAEWPVQDADSVVQDIRNQVTNITLFGVLAVFLLAPFFASRLLKPIRLLKEGAEAVENGKWDTKVEIATDDELQELGEAFNKMTVGLKRLQELKNEFVFIAAHELRTPVTAIKGYLSMIREGSAGELNDKTKEYLEPVWQSNERLGKLVDDILEIARSEAGKLKVEVKPENIVDIIQAALLQIKPVADKKKISLQYSPQTDLPRVLTDTGKLTEIVLNLISNAIKYNHDGGWIKIYYKVEPQFVMTHIEDNGFGMSVEDQKHVFEKFFRAESGATKTVQGTGLGLFITHELVEKMGGKISFKSTEGQGTTFSFGLPIA
ncbi:MAG: sensor histidine kinase [bacterium]|nr:sensor histidine kinase [bacterium]